MIKQKLSALGLLLLLLVGGCADKGVENGADKETSTAEQEMLTIENNGVELPIADVPQRAVTLNQHVTEVMLALGLEDHMVGTAYLDDEILPEYREAYEKIDVLADAYPSKEIFLGKDPDFAYAGWASAFKEDSLGTQEELLAQGIIPYLHQSSTIVGPKLDDIFTDIDNIGKIFGVEDRSAKLISDMKSQIEEIKQTIPVSDEKKRVFVFDSGDTSALTVGQNFLNELITIAGGDNIFSDLEKNWGQVNWEEVVERNPEIIVIIDYGDTTVDQKIDFLNSVSMLADTTAIQEQHFVVVPLSAAAEGVRIPMALETIVEGFYNPSN
ncbi:ABC-type transporter, periplasmic subunit [Bacillus sp. OxB-1]|uniref:ABC transporter substrate-binding protein n=1 Tax=Bacillus sp. (strain OxB-1) TaxID=98228 RepID=UPI0005821B31|nr:ABC transporter substrate-binding protein [Bacillus sp. OxB-1]BAQ09707.1 ABC-type transporter, periplasmic subunit [Bacillus sp. OxB-1]